MNTIELPCEMLDEIVAENLKTTITGFFESPDIHYKDYEYRLNAFLHVLEYYMPHNEFMEFITELESTFGN